MKAFVKPTILILIMVILLLGSFPVTAKEPPSPTYTYSYITNTPNIIYSPTAYEPVAQIGVQTLGDVLVEPSDFFIDKNGSVYILDKGANIILVVDKNWKPIKQIAGFQNKDGFEDSFNGPEGIFVADDGTIYVADTQNNRVVILDKDEKHLASVTTPQSSVFDANYTFLPTKVAVDTIGRLYVISRDDYAGILQFSADWTFFGYLGSNRVVYNIIDMFWKKIMTESQKNKSVQFIPVEYTNLFLDDQEFIYTVSASPMESTPIKLLNNAGDNVLLRAGYSPIVAGDAGVRSQLIDICADSTGTYYALDLSLGHIFVYNNEGYLLYAFGSIGKQVGTFTTPAAIDIWNDNLYVLDSSTKSISVFAMTEYAKEIRMAQQHYNSGRYDDSMASWKRVAKMNGNFELAYAQIGKIQLMKGEYEEAMESFLLGNVRGDAVQQQNGYNKAFTEYRKRFLSDHLALLIVIGIVVVVGGFAASRLIKRRKAKKGRT